MPTQDGMDEYNPPWDWLEYFAFALSHQQVRDGYTCEGGSRAGDQYTAAFADATKAFLTGID